MLAARDFRSLGELTRLFLSGKCVKYYLHLGIRSVFPLLALPLLSVTAPTYQVAQSSPNSSVADILPADTPLVGLVNTKVADWNALSRFQLFKVVYAGVKSFLPPDINFNYARDVDSWLGDEVALVLLPRVGTAPVTQDSNFLTLAPVKDETRLQQLLAQIKPNNKRQTVTQQQYKGVTILEFKTQPASTPPPSVPSRPPKSSSFAPLQFSFLEQLNLLPRWVLAAAPLPPNPPKPTSKQPAQEFAIALLPGLVVAASSPKPIQQLLDLPKGSETLLQNPAFQRTIQRPQVSPKLFTLYEDPNKFLPLLNSLVPSQIPFPLPNSFSAQQVKDYSSLDGFVLVQPEGLRFQVNAYRQIPRTVPLISPTEANQILERIPASSYSVSSSHNLKMQWQTAIATISAEPKLKPGLTELRNFVRTTTGLDLDREIVAWMDGNYALFAYPTKGGIAKLLDPKFNLGVGFLVQTSDRAAAEAALKKLDRFINSSSKGEVTAINRSVKGIPVTSWEIKGRANDGVLAYGWVDNDTLLITTGLGAIADLVPSSYQSLPKAYTFTTATNSLPSPNEGYFYINTGSLLSWAYGFVPPSQSNDPYLHVFKQIAGTINSFSATSSATAEREQFDSLVVLAPARAPNKVLP